MPNRRPRLVPRPARAPRRGDAREPAAASPSCATAPERQRNADNDHPYRHGSDFHYLTGFDEPGRLDRRRGERPHDAGRAAPKDVEREIWDGLRLGPDAAPAALGVDAARRRSTQLDAVVIERLAQPAVVWSSAATPDVRRRSTAGSRRCALASARAWKRRARRHDLDPLLAEMRLVKDAGEIATMRRAAAISAGAHVRAMRFCAAPLSRRRGAGLAEYEIEAELLHEFRRHGADGPAYGSIVAAGANACVLHYAPGRARLHAAANSA